jgi:hypothetical protein
MHDDLALIVNAIAPSLHDRQLAERPFWPARTDLTAIALGPLYAWIAFRAGSPRRSVATFFATLAWQSPLAFGARRAYRASGAWFAFLAALSWFTALALGAHQPRRSRGSWFALVATLP